MHEVAPELIGATLLVNGVGGVIVEVEAYHHTDPAAHSYGGPTERNARDVRPARLCLRLPLLRHPLVPEFRLRGGRLGQRRADPGAGADGRPCCHAAAARRCAEPRALCSGPGKLCEALGITSAHNGLALDRPPFELRARDGRAGDRRRPAHRHHQGGRTSRGATG